MMRGKQVMLDSDLAILYGCKNGTKEINQAVKNNPLKFPDRYCFKLDDTEYNSLRSKILTTNTNMSRINPTVFTEQGIYMLATILKTKMAASSTIKITDTFVEMRKFINENKELYHIGSSLKDLGKKVFAISKIEDNDYLDLLLSKIKN